MFDKDFTEELFNVANSVIKNIGNTTITARSIIGLPYTQFCCDITELDELDVSDIWIKWIKAYRDFVKYEFIGNTKYVGNEPYIYWRIKPEIIKTQCKDDYEVILYARLLISQEEETTDKS